MTLPKCWWPLGVFLAVGCGESTQDRDRKKLISINNMKQIGLALLMDHDANNFFPGKNENGKPRNLSWRVSILPYLEQKALFDQFKQDEPWDGPHNQVLLAQMPRVFLDPRFQQAGATETYYQGFGGAGGILGAESNISLVQLSNFSRPINTFLVVEAGAPVPWTKPQDLVHDLKKPLPRFGGPKGEDFLALLCTGTDGKQGPIVHTVPADTDEKTLRCLIQWDNTRPFLPPWQK